jgi:hypothetical protein
MINRIIIFRLTLFSLMFVMAGLSLWCVQYIGENYFFDKLYFNKSIKHGYINCVDIGCEWELYGSRSRDYLALFEAENSSKQVLGTQSESDYLVAVIGDSFVWGQGVREEAIVARVLEKKLTRYRHTRVLSLGFPGDSILDNYNKYLSIRKALSVDLYVFLIVENDLLLNHHHPLFTSNQQALLDGCMVEEPYTYNENDDSENYDYGDLLLKSLNNSSNRCLWKTLITMLPKDKTLFIIADDHLAMSDDHPAMNAHQLFFKNTLEEVGHRVLLTKEVGKLDQFARYFPDSGKLVVSELESHPSAVSHDMWATLVTNELLQNNTWGFIEL